MRFLADENLPLSSVEGLRRAGHEVTAILEVEPGASDSRVLERAVREREILITFDRDFGALIFQGIGPIPMGVVFLRFVPESPAEAAQVVQELVEMPGVVLDGRFTVLDRERIRQRRLPVR